MPWMEVYITVSHFLIVLVPWDISLCLADICPLSMPFHGLSVAAYEDSSQVVD